MDEVIRPLAKFNVGKKNLTILDNKLNKIIDNVDKKLSVDDKHLTIVNKLVDKAILDMYKILSS